jgi:hypothetical protein
MAQSDTPKSQDNTTNHANDVQNGGGLGNALPSESRNLPPPPEHGDTDQNTSQPPWWKQQKNWHFFTQIVLLLVGVYVAWIYSRQLDQMIESNHLNQEALVSVQRAFVQWGGFSIPGNS